MKTALTKPNEAEILGRGSDNDNADNFVLLKFIDGPTVDSVHPLYGPVAGGTRLTMTGQLLRSVNVTAVCFGEYTVCQHDIRLSYCTIAILIY